eukprot:TRINITY_DN3451_c0_g1_i1.p1 TRINITY_DN3451_c0_g1~~TRINITY_DN3451_c0_g1_i1.p1  ORF type:complete len:1302 (-),score=280.44 TRINITY_DN3451_c0_g1_i1:19-3480(-)
MEDVAPLRTHLVSRELRTLDESPRSAPVFVAGPSENAPLPGLSVSGQAVHLPIAATSDISKLVECFTKSGATSVGNFHLLSASEIKLKNPNWDLNVANLAQDVIAPTLTGSRLDDSASNEYHSELSYALLEEAGSCGLEAALAELRASKPIGVIFVFLPSLHPGDEIFIKGPKDSRESVSLPESLEYQPQYLGVRFDVDLSESKPAQGPRLSLVYRIITRPASVREERRTRLSHTSAGSRTVSNISLKLLAETSSIGSRPEDDDFTTLPVDPEDTFDIDMLILNATLGSDSLSEEDPESETPQQPAVVEDKSLGPVLYVPAMGGNRNFVSYATVEGLLSVLTEQQDTAFIETFIMCYEYFLTTPLLLQKLITTFFRGKLQTTSTASNRLVAQLRIVNVMKKLVELRYWHFKDDKSSYNILAKFINRLITSGDEHERSWARALSTSMKQNSDFTRMEVSFEPPSPRTLKALPSLPKPANRTVTDFSTRQLARHLTLVDHELWSSIKIEEFYHKAFEKGDKEQRTPNLQKYIKRFNDVTNWVVAAILQAQKRKDRVNVIVKFIRLMYELKTIKNFNGMMAVFGALNMIAIQKLKKTWKDVPKKAMDLMRAVGDILPSTGNMKAYRDTIRDAAPPALPFSGFMLTDLIYAEEMSTWSNPSEIRALDDFQSLSPRSMSSDSSEGAAAAASATSGTSPSTSTLASTASTASASTDTAAAVAAPPASPPVSPRSPPTSPREEPGKYINWKKMQHLSSVFNDIIRFQRTRFPYLEVKEIAEYVSDLSKHSWLLTEDEMMEIANRLEGTEPATDSAPNSPAKNDDLIGRLKKKSSNRKAMVQSTFEDVPRDPNVFHEFAKYLRGRFNEENLLFWDACYKFKQGEYKDQAEKKKKAQEVFSKFVSGDTFDGQFVVGLDAAIVRTLRKSLGEEEIDSSLFEKAAQTVEFSVLRPAFNEFGPNAPMTMGSAARQPSSSNLFRRDSAISVGSDSPSRISSKKTLKTSSSSIDPPAAASPKKDLKSASKKDLNAGATSDAGGPLSFDDLQRDSNLLKAFHPFLEARFAAENLVFWEAVYKYKWLIDHDDKTEAKARADSIYTKFITGSSDGGKFAVGLSNPVAKEIKRRLDRGELTPALFDTAMTEVEQVALRPAFQDFIKTYKPA